MRFSKNANCSSLIGGSLEPSCLPRHSSIPEKFAAPPCWSARSNHWMTSTYQGPSFCHLPVPPLLNRETTASPFRRISYVSGLLSSQTYKNTVNVTVGNVLSARHDSRSNDCCESSSPARHPSTERASRLVARTPCLDRRSSLNRDLPKLVAVDHDAGAIQIQSTKERCVFGCMNRGRQRYRKDDRDRSAMGETHFEHS